MLERLSPPTIECGPLISNNYISVVSQTEARIAAMEVQLREQQELRELLLKNPDFERVLSLLARRNY